MINKGMMSSNTDQWATPQTFFDEVNTEFDCTLDVCADYSNAKCGLYFTKEMDGLKQNWGSHVCWMNPPYGREIGKWVKKAAESGTVVVALLPARTDTRWFHDHVQGKALIRFIKGRLKFGGAKNSAPFPSMLVVWGKDVNSLEGLI
jgi:phage N-6-adenine-methyltransferase